MSIAGGSFRCAAALGVASLFVPSVARAEDEAAAQALFVQAREAMAKGEYAKACPMLEESYRLVPGTGTKFNLGDCYEKLGQTARAWASFREVAAASRLAGQKEREGAAKERASRLEGDLCRLTIQVAPQREITVTRDGDVVGAGQWSVALPIDPGAHVVEAKAPAMKAWSSSFTMASCPSSRTVLVPVLVPAPEPAPVQPRGGSAPPLAKSNDVAPAAPARSSTRTIVTAASIGLGVVGVGLGSYFGVRALSLRDQSNSGHCTGNQCDDTGIGLRDDSRAYGTGATIALASGAALIALGTILWLTD